MIRRSLAIFLVSFFAVTIATAQELNAKVTINHSQVQGTDDSVFDDLQQNLTSFINDKQWTNLQFQKRERIACVFSITVTKYDSSTNLFTCKATIQASRPVFNASYTSTIYNNTDANFDFEYAQFDQLIFNDENVDNQLTALIAYYAYLIIGINLDTFSPKGGEDVLLLCMNVANNAQNFEFTGWKSFSDDRNRYAIISDYLDGGMATFRQLQYDYYRNGLDEMVNNAERGRTNISQTIQENLKQCHADKPFSLLPQIWTDYKKDELANIYRGKGTEKEKAAVYEVIFSINPSQDTSWKKIME